MSNEVGKLKASIELDTSAFDSGIQAIIKGNNQILNAVSKMSDEMVRAMRKQIDAMDDLAQRVAENTRRELQSEQKRVAAAKQKEIATKKAQNSQESYIKWWLGAMQKLEREEAELDYQYHVFMQKRMQTEKKVADLTEKERLKATRAAEKEEDELDWQYHLHMQRRQQLQKKAAQEQIREQKRVAAQRESLARREAAAEARRIKEQASKRATAMRNAMKSINMDMGDASSMFSLSGGSRRDVKQYTNELHRYAAALDKVEEEYRDVRKANHALDLDLKKMRNTLKRNEKALKDNHRGLAGFTKGMKKMGKGINVTFLAVVGLNQAVELGKSIFHGMRAAVEGIAMPFLEAAEKAESLQTRMSSVLNSSKEGQKTFDDMAVFATTIPFTFESVLGAATNLLPVLKNGREELGEWMPMMADLAAVSGLTLEETASNFIKMYSAGAAAADLFRERGINAMLGFIPGVAYTADQTIERIRNLMEQGSLFFEGATKKLAYTWQGQVSMMQDKWFLFRKMLMDHGPFDYIKGIILAINEYFDEMRDDGSLEAWADHWGQTVTGWLKSITAIVVYLGSFLENIGSALKSIEDFLYNRKKESGFGFWDMMLSTVPVVGHINIAKKAFGGILDENGVLGADDIVDPDAPMTIEQRLQAIFAAIEKFSAKAKQMREMDNTTFISPRLTASVSSAIEGYNKEIAKLKLKADKAGLTAREKAEVKFQQERAAQLANLGTDDSGLEKAEQFRKKFDAIFKRRKATIAEMQKQAASGGGTASLILAEQKMELEAFKKKSNAELAALAKQAGMTTEMLNSRLQLNAALRDYHKALLEAGEAEDAKRFKDRQLTLEAQEAALLDKLTAAGGSTYDKAIAKAAGDAKKLRAGIVKALGEDAAQRLDPLLDRIKELNEQVADKDLLKKYTDKMRELRQQFAITIGGAGGEYVTAMRELEKFARENGMLNDEYLKQQKLLEGIYDLQLKLQQLAYKRSVVDRMSGSQHSAAIDEFMAQRTAVAQQSGLSPEQRSKENALAGQKFTSGLVGTGQNMDPDEVFKQRYAMMQTCVMSYQAEILKLGEAYKNGTINADQFRASQEAAKVALNDSQTITDQVSKIEAMSSAIHMLADVIGNELTQALTDLAETGRFDLEGFLNSLAKQIRALAISKAVSLTIEGLYQTIMALIYDSASMTAGIDPALGAAYKAAAIGAQVAATGAFAGAAMFGSLGLGALLGGMSHDGISSIPKEGTWLLDKGERVVDSRTNEDLKSFLDKQSGGGGVNMTVNIHNSDEEGVLKALPQLKKVILETVNVDISTGGQTYKTIKSS